MANPPLKIYLGDIVRMKKQHPCGSYIWEVTRTGIDIGLKCQGCGRRVMIPRTKFERACKEILSRANPEGQGGAPKVVQ